MITSLSHFLERVESVASDHPERALWFRGVSTDHALCPRLYRDCGHSFDHHGDYLWTLFHRFMRLARVEPAQCPDTLIDWLQLMQHHGVPTPLLDWTTSPLVALYFAVQNPQHIDDTDRIPLVWYLDAEQIQAFYSRTCEDLRIEERLMRQPGLREVQRLLPTNPNRRVLAQCGQFTVHPLPLAGAPDALLDCSMIQIDPRCKRQIKSSLRFNCINEATMFPDLDGAARYLNATRHFSE